MMDLGWLARAWMWSRQKKKQKNKPLPKQVKTLGDVVKTKQQQQPQAQKPQAQKPQGVYIDFNKIKMIESSGNPKAYNKRSQARGLYQITPIVLEEWNNFHPKQRYTVDHLFDPKINEQIARWYMNERIPQMLRYFKIKDTVANRIIAYNAGIGVLRDYLRGKRTLPAETKGYLRKYGIQGY